ncbi:MAG: hypothetical protein AB7O63_06985 [Reyranellaceae bacterium]
MTALACTLVSGTYHIGAAALANSLHRHGYRGVFTVFHRGPRPDWQADGAWRAPDLLDLGPLSVRFVADTAQEFVALRKPDCLQALFALEPDCQAAAFIDADIVMRAPWQRIEHWLSCGIAVCVDGWMPQTPTDDNPLRVRWRELLGELGRPARSVAPYFNSGFVGVQRRHLDFVALWRQATDRIVAAAQAPIGHTHTTDRSDPFFIPDQDAMNVALMGVEAPISALGPEGMGFSAFGTHMTHFATHPKPWLARYTRRALAGMAPSIAERQFWDHLRGPIRPMPDAERRLREFDLAAAKMIARFYSRR